MTTITSAGIGSGLDIESLITKLMTVEQEPLKLLDTKEASYQAKLTAYGTLKSSLSSLQTAAKSLSTVDSLSPIKASVADTSVLTATATSSAIAGSYNVEVKSLAQQQKLMSGGYAATTDTVGEGTLTISFGTYADDGSGNTVFNANSAKPSKQITIDPSNHSLAGIRDAINKANIGVTASIINDGTANGNRLVITSNDTGTSNALKIDVAEASGITGLSNLAYDATTSGSASSKLTQTVAARDAVIKVDNVTITKSSNVITDAIEGVTLNLTKETPPGTTTQLKVAKDTSSIQTSIESFVNAYNSTLNTIKSSTAYDSANNQAAALTGDSTARTIQTQLRSLFATPVPGAPTGVSMLSDIGITFQKDGTLGIDSTKLSAALADPSKDLSKLFATTSTGNGYAYQLDSLIGRILSPVGLLAGSTDSINTSIKDIDNQRDALNLRLDATEKRYRAQFTALDTLMASMQQTSTYLTQQLSSLSNNSN